MFVPLRPWVKSHFPRPLLELLLACWLKSTVRSVRGQGHKVSADTGTSGKPLEVARTSAADPPGCTTDGNACLRPRQQHDLAAEPSPIDAGMDFACGGERQSLDHDGLNGTDTQSLE
jgi:hypothetical protein